MTVLLQIRNAHKRYGDQILLDGAECTLTSDTKVGFIGRNGAGKSTLLKCILGDDELDTGEIIRHPKLKIGYLRQHDPFLPGETALEFLMRDSGQPDWKCGEVAGEFEIKGKRVSSFQRCCSMSRTCFSSTSLPTSWTCARKSCLSIS